MSNFHLNKIQETWTTILLLNSREQYKMAVVRFPPRRIFRTVNNKNYSLNLFNIPSNIPFKFHFVLNSHSIRHNKIRNWKAQNFATFPYSFVLPVRVFYKRPINSYRYKISTRDYKFTISILPVINVISFNVSEISSVRQTISIRHVWLDLSIKSLTAA